MTVVFNPVYTQLALLFSLYITLSILYKTPLVAIISFCKVLECLFNVKSLKFLCNVRKSLFNVVICITEVGGIDLEISILSTIWHCIN